MTAPLYHLGRFSSRHHILVIAAWIVAAIGLAIAGAAAGHRTSDDLTLPGTGSTKATDVLQERLPDQAYGSNPLVLQSHHGRLDNSSNKQAVDDAVKQRNLKPDLTSIGGSGASDLGGGDWDGDNKEKGTAEPPASPPAP